ncbi:hypothetical protein HNY73_015083 [Argiope bruennichi]|uniref:CCHC-type domain-containing protein n=1 Tax=Argiope bruennichi TaxID=94029 RepID=A0A8T0ER07_ARGBR|nr:hypothetical protein HNY73_015083 [Argiope bruennichi]
MDPSLYSRGQQQLKQWTAKDELALKQAKSVPSAGNAIATVFGDLKGILLLDYLEKGRTINAEYYSNLLNELHFTIKEKRPDRKNDDHTHDARLDHKRITQPQPTCYSCGLKGHKSTSCTNKERGKKCYGCKNFGHIHANCPKNSTNSISTANRNTSTPSDRTVHPISESSGQISANPMHIPITLAKIQFTALCDTGSQATIINDKTYRSIGSPPLHPSYITFSGIGRDKIHSIGFFQDFITIEDTTLPAKIYVVSDTSIPLDVIIGMDFLQQTEFTFVAFVDSPECLEII